MANLPNYIDHVAAAAARYPDAWRNAHSGNARSDDFIKLLAADLHAIDPNVGLNGKRGNANDLSDDALCYRAPGKSIDVRTGQSVCVIDVIAAAGSSDARPSWGEVWDANSLPTKATWVQPEKVDAPEQPPIEPPPPPPATKCSAPEVKGEVAELRTALISFMNQIAALRNDHLIMHNQLAVLNERMDKNASLIKDVRECFRQGLSVELNANLKGWGVSVGSIVGTARVGDPE
jgi:hypothetical protein